MSPDLAMKDDRWGYVDRTGKLVVQPKYTAAGPASEGMGPVQVGGKPVFDGEMVVGGRWGFVNTKGEVVVKPRFRAVKAFSRGIARVNVGGRYDGCVGITGGKWGTIDKAGRFVVEPRADAPENAKSTRKPARRKEWDSPRGEKPRWRAEGRLSEGLVRVRTEDGLTGFADRSCKLVTNPRFSDADSFSEGRAAVAIGGNLGTRSELPFGKTAYVDKQGRLITKPMFDKGLTFYDGLAQVFIGCHIRILPGLWEGKQLAHLEGGRWGYINPLGKMVWEPSV